MSKNSPSPNDNPFDLSEINSQFLTILNSLSSLKSQISMLTAQCKSVEKSVKKRMKQLNKEIKKNKNKGNRQASGFALPSKISNDLCNFMGKPEGTEIARTEVTKYIINYIKQNNLPDKVNKKVIKPDKRLSSLLNIKKNEEVTYFNLQKYMNKHFVKA
jgi:chromatin remodeling complex protein RSC6